MSSLFDGPRTSAVLVAQIREAPDIAEADRVANTREEELEFASPVTPGVFRVAVQLGKLLGVHLKPDIILKRTSGQASFSLYVMTLFCSLLCIQCLMIITIA